MSKGGFKLTKWISNDRKVLESIPEILRAKDVKDLDLREGILPIERALGVKWCVNTDTFGFKIVVKERPFTRRGILSVVSSVYDPLGLASPFILPAKILLQNLCRIGLDWDDEIPSSYKLSWQKWLDGLPKLSEFSIPRCFKPSNFGEIVETQLHYFSDASQAAYAAASYIRVRDVQDQVHCSLLI